MSTDIENENNNNNMLIAQGMCPKCESEHIEYGAIEIGEGDTVYYPATCEVCGCTFHETYSLEFIGHEDIN